MSEHSADKDAGRALAERLLDDAMIEEVVEAIRVAQAAGHVEYRRRVGYHGRVTIAKTVLDAICERLGVPTSIDLLMDQHTHVTSPVESEPVKDWPPMGPGQPKTKGELLHALGGDIKAMQDPYVKRLLAALPDDDTTVLPPGVGQR